MNPTISRIRERINEDLKTAIKNKEVFKRDALRMLNASLKQVEIDQRITLTDKEVVDVLKSAYKQRQDAAQAYKKGNRQDLYEKETQEMELILQYLPPQLDDQSLENELRQIIAKVEAKNIKDMGKVMIEAKNLNADGRRIAQMLKVLLDTTKS